MHSASKKRTQKSLSSYFTPVKRAPPHTQEETTPVAVAAAKRVRQCNQEKSAESKITTTTATTTAGHTLVSSVSDTSDLIKRLHLRSKEQKPASKITTSTDSVQLVQRQSGIKYTPLELQVIETKEKHPDVLLAVEVGYKFRFFGEDARIASNVLGIMCTTASNFYNASVPTPRLMIHVRRLVHAGYKVGVMRQMETAALKAAGDNKSAPFTRCLADVYTTGTMVDDILVNQSNESIAGANEQYLMVVVEIPHVGRDKNASISIMAVQVATGTILYDCFEDGHLRNGLETRLGHLQPGEILLSDGLSSETMKVLSAYVGYSLSYDSECRRKEPLLEHSSCGIRIAFLEATELNDPAAARNLVISFYTEHKSPSAMEHALDLPDLTVIALAQIIKYLEPFNLSSVFLVSDGSNVQLFNRFHTHTHMLLSATTLRTLDVFTTTDTTADAVGLKDLLKPDARMGGRHSRYIRGGAGSLFSIMDHTRSQFGRRLLRRWVAHPLVSPALLADRMDAVEYLVHVSGKDSPVHKCVGAMQAKLGQLVDLERGLCRIHYKQASPQELLRILSSLQTAVRMLPLDIVVSEPRLLAQVLNHDIWSTELVERVKRWLSYIDYQNAKSGYKERLFKHGPLADSIQKHQDRIVAVERELDEYDQAIADLLKDPSFKFKSVSGVDYLIEVTNNKAKNVPLDWVKIQGTRSHSRFHTAFIVQRIAERERCRETLQHTAKGAYNQFLSEISESYSELRQLVSSLATMDALFSLAALARTEGYSRPIFTLADGEAEDASIDLVEAVNPILGFSNSAYVPNDIQLGNKITAPRAMILTGPNAGGKSSLIRTVALISIMAQCGSYVPASSAHLSIVDAIHTRMGASDNMRRGESTFMVEMRQTAELMRQVTPRSLAILDELGRGTSTHDGAAIAYAVLGHLIRTGPLTLFVTHYSHLVESFAENPRVKSCHMAYLAQKRSSEEDVDIGQITFLFKLVDGGSADSFGLNVARLAGLPGSLLVCAQDHARRMHTEADSQSANKWATKLQEAVASYK